MKNSREYLTSRSGRMQQFAGAQRSVLLEGKGFGVEMVDLWNQAGVQLQVFPGRGMDIGRLTLGAVPFSYMAKPGVVGPGYYESNGMNWLRNFFAGMLTTCGLSNVGGPEVIEDPILGTTELGLHGRISNCAAENVCVSQRWEDDDYIVSVSGEMRESCLHKENFVLRRKIWLSLAEKTVHIEDEIENESYLDLPLMLLYHINVGFPVLSEQAHFMRSQAITQPREDYGSEHWQDMELPQAGYTERVYFHKPVKGAPALAAVVNEPAQLAMVVEFDPEQLPCLTQWKMCNLSEYVMGIEPGNCHPVGRTKTQEEGQLEILPAGARKRVEIKLRLMNTKEEIDALLKKEVLL